MDEIDLELVNLLRAETKDAPDYLPIPLEKERTAIMEAFSEHLESIRSISDGTIDQARERDTLTNLIHAKIEEYPLLFEGEARVSGDGIYLVHREELDQAEACLIEGGVSLQGTINNYTVAPLVNLDYSSDDIESELSVWVELSNTVVIDKNNKALEFHKRVMAPMALAGLSFEKLISSDFVSGMTFDELFSEADIQSKDLAAKINDPILRAACEGAEHELNRMAVSDAEHFDARREHRAVLLALTKTFEQDNKLILSADKAIDPRLSDPVTITNREAYYSGVTIIQLASTEEWRVAYGFCIYDDEGMFEQVVHILPENIQSAQYE